MNKPPKLIKLYENIGKQIRKARSEEGITLEELAGRCGRDWTYLSQIERAKSIPSMETLFLICEQLRIPFASLFESHKPEVTYKIDKYSNKILYFLRESSPRDKKTAVEVIKKLFDK